MTISYFTVGAVLEQQAREKDDGERDGVISSMAMCPLLRSRWTSSTRLAPDAAFDHGLAVILDGLEKKSLPGNKNVHR
ncbi:hypothetical protein ASD52_30245 [Ensifer sp. Root142]|uniref:TetR/AcrR family transcriptional regulator C-terminal domain-containing protein n=1 Tax=Ensifer sp. Root142 TaxID=1736461 RepID=UPI000710B5C6|nr:TetR/AcrR family transcriptional regulator C-terminal domain-containing protein [Ensifer sp. Root142]KQY70282.1 hypothetical protein ASD52_30245 [Ensifer sp. Root142]